MRNLLFKAAFYGAPFHGWQIQNNATSVQGEISRVWYQLTGEKANIIGCSRTDSGVHANEYFFNVRTECNIPSSGFPAALGTKLPHEIAVYDCKEVPLDFNARYDCIKKEYKYLIYNDSVLSPFLYKRAFQYKYPVNEQKMNEAAKLFIGEYDFSAFCAAGSSVDSKVRTIFDASVEREGKTVVFTVSGNGFLYNMVRIMAGTLISVNEGKNEPEDIIRIINSRSRNKAGITLPPDGLYLNKVFYGSETDEAKI